MQPANFPRRRVVWIVDDSPMESSVAREALAHEYEVRTFSEGAAALETIAAGPLPDLLVLDWVMPGLTGIEICQFLRSRPDTAELPVLLLTVQQNTDQVVVGLGAGANDYLGKPFAAPELRARVGALIRSRTLRERTDQVQRVLRRVLRQVPDAVVTVNARHEIIFANAEAERVLKLTEEQLAGKPLRDLIPDLQLENIPQSPPGGQVTLPDVRIEGLTLAPRVSIPPQDDEGNTTFTLRDVTEARRDEARRVDFYSMVAHDLRSPLGALQMRLQLLQQGKGGAASPEMRLELDRMLANVRELMRMISDFLDVEQIGTGHFHIDREQLDLCGVVGSAIEDYRPLAEARELKITQESGPPQLVVGDSRRLRQVVANLLSNAIKFTHRGGAVGIRLHGDASFVQLDVRDSGPGISDAAQQRLFRKYERVEGSTAGKVEGTGLGLVIVKEIVEAHGGTAGVHSAAGAGSTFWIRLPRARQS